MKIVVVDDDKLICMSLKTIIEASSSIEVKALGYSGEEAIELYNEYKPDIMLMDIRMDGMTGLEAGKSILKKHSDAKILFLTTFEDDEYIITALKLGAKGYILKQHFEGIVSALKAVYGGQSVFGQEVVSKLPSILKETNHKKDISQFDLSEKEFDIINLVSKGFSNKEIANELFLSEGTIRNYISSILEKLELRDRTQLAIFYFNNLT
ncbi:response regulator [Clostridium culturomicium]|uniref:response regulator n=1 Tax=Clostridium culturomicium TaxID=1499683 RepID=UPI00059151DB|nr:response regulator transcription factor [Clostridium culturomicium]